jgi:tetratricopeptide (TPR) repeat protein
VLHLEALQLARQLGDPEALFTSAGALLGQDWAPRDEEERRRLAEEVLRWPRHGVNTYQLGATLGFGASVLLSWGERERADEVWAQVRKLAEHLRDGSPELRAVRQEGATRALDGELERALDIGGHLIARGEELGQPFASRTYAFLLVRRPLVWLGRIQEALELVDERVRAGRRGDTEDWRVLLHALSGNREAAVAALDRLVAEDVHGAEGEEMSTDRLVTLLEAGVELGRRELVADLASRLQPVAGMSYQIYGCTCPARHLGAAAALLGKPDEASAYYHQALAAAGKIGFRPEVALTRLQLAELLLEHDRDEHAKALEHLDFAIEEFRAMKMRPSLERALRHKGLLKA